MCGQVLDVSRSDLRVVLSSRLGPGTPVEITFHRPAVILGEVRQCRQMGDTFHVRIQIQEVLISSNRHVDDDELALYVSGKGLTEAEFFYVRRHFAECEECRRRLREREGQLA